jgi:hypothetical protein
MDNMEVVKETYKDNKGSNEEEGMILEVHTDGMLTGKEVQEIKVTEK